MSGLTEVEINVEMFITMRLVTTKFFNFLGMNKTSLVFVTTFTPMHVFKSDH